MKTTVEKIIEAAISGLNLHGFKVEIRDHMSRENTIDLIKGIYGISDSLISKLDEETILAAQMDCAGFCSPKELDAAETGEDTIVFFSKGMNWIFHHDKSLVGNSETLDHFVTKMVRHEWRHSCQFVQLREAGWQWAIKYSATVDKFPGYGNGPLEKDAFLYQDGIEQEWTQFLNHWVENWEKYGKEVIEDSYDFEE